MVGWCFFFNDTATTEIYTLSLHDALPIFEGAAPLHAARRAADVAAMAVARVGARPDRKSTRLNSSRANISYAVFCLKKKKTKDTARASQRASTVERCSVRCKARTATARAR